MPYKITKHSADVGVPERAFVFFLAIAIVVVFIAVVSVFFPHDSRTTQDASPTTTLTPFEPSVYNIVAIVTGIGQGVVTLRTPEGTQVNALVDAATIITASESVAGIAGLTLLREGDEVVAEFRTPLKNTNDTAVAYLRVYKRDNELVRETDPLPSMVTSVSGTITSLGTNEFILLSDGNNFSDPSKSPEKIIIFTTDYTTFFVSGMAYAGIEALQFLQPGDRVVVQSSDNIKNAAEVTASRIRVF